MRWKLPDSRGLRFSLIAGALVALLALDGAYAALRFRSSFKSAACNLKRATDRIEELDLDNGIMRLERAEDSVRSARGYLGHPPVALAGYLPGVGDDVRALKALTGVAREAVAAGLEGATAAEAMGLAGEGSLSAIYDEGKVRFDTLERASEAMADGLEHLTAASNIIDGSPTPRFGQVRSAFFGANRLVQDATAQLSDGLEVLDALPGILGARGLRRYFLAFQTPSEARAGGGLVGVYGVLEAEDGRLSLEKVAPIRELVPKLRGAVTGPSWYDDLYGNLDALGGWREANQSPSFPTVARVLLRMYESSVGERLDGVISMDPFVVADLTRGTGPIRARGLDIEVGPDNAAEVLLKDIYLAFERREDEQNRYLRDLVDQLWSKMAEGDIDGEELAKGLAHSIRTQHLKMFSLVPSDQAALESIGLAGDPAHFGPNVQMVFHNNFAANKIDYFLERSQDVNVVITDDGDAKIVTTVTLFNGAPRGELSVLKKSDVNELPSGLNRMSLHFMLPEGAMVDEFFTGAVTNTFFDGSEQGRYPVAWRLVDIQVQETVRLAVSYTVPDLVSFADDEGLFEMTFLPQSLVTPDNFDLRIVPPPGFRLGRDLPGARFSTDPYSFSGELRAPRTFTFDLVGPGGEIPSESSLGSACS